MVGSEPNRNAAGRKQRFELELHGCLAAHMPQIKTGSFVRRKIRYVRSLGNCVHKLDHAWGSIDMRMSRRDEQADK